MSLYIIHQPLSKYQHLPMKNPYRLTILWFLPQKTLTTVGIITLS